MQWREWVQSEEFQEYRRREIEEGAKIAHQLWMYGDPEYIRGALDMLSKILRLPETFSDAPETKEFMGTLVARDFAEFEVKFLRKHLIDE